MTLVIFYEKPGCINNTKQKTLLKEAGHLVEARSLLTEAWTPERLRPFFGSLPITEWFNLSATRIKSGEVIPSNLDEQTALQLMVADPLLVRRPLIQVGEVCQVGFDIQKIDTWIGLTPEIDKSIDLQNCPRTQ
jgi:nitrogenase-associated protein